MKKIILILSITSVFLLCSCSSNTTKVIYEDDLKKYSETTSDKEQTIEEQNFVNNFEGIIETDLQDINVNFVSHEDIKNILSYNTGILLFANIETLEEKEKQVIINFIETADGGGFPVNYYKTNQKEDKQVLDTLNGVITNFDTPTMLFFKDGEIISTKTVQDFSTTDNKELYRIFKEEIYKIIE